MRQSDFESGAEPAASRQPVDGADDISEIRLLATLDPKRCAVLPFQDRVKNGTAILEVYPRQTLTSLGLPDSGYKSKDKEG
ncbi:MAG: hypothetical protein U0103_04210 [Candidatus Obscuribacterales bacterium]